MPVEFTYEETENPKEFIVSWNGKKSLFVTKNGAEDIPGMIEEISNPNN